MLDQNTIEGVVELSSGILSASIAGTHMFGILAMTGVIVFITIGCTGAYVNRCEVLHNIILVHSLGMVCGEQWDYC